MFVKDGFYNDPSIKWNKTDISQASNLSRGKVGNQNYKFI